MTPTRPQRGRGAFIALAVALAAGGTLIALGPGSGSGADPPPAPPGRVTAATAWPSAQKADIDPAMPDGPLFTPALFLDATTAIGTAPTPDGAQTRLLLRTASGPARELRRASLDGNPQFDAFTASGDDIVWAESGDQRPGVRLWAATRSGGPARLLTADTGNAVFSGNQYDLVLADGRAHWAAAPRDGVTEIRSVPLTGGRVTVRAEPGEWSQTAWPWLADETENRLRNTLTKRDVPIATTGPEQVTCSPAWCRVMVLNGEGLARIDLMRPDGSDRRRVAGGNAQAAVNDVAALDRFEILAEPGPDSDLTGAAALLVHDIATSRTVLVDPAADGAFTAGGMLWWSTGDQDSITWHTIDLRTA
ncbi:MAG: hypothetical protein ABW022_03595 [Actinoplanes sp.]